MNYCVDCEHRLQGDYTPCYDTCWANDESRDPVSGRGLRCWEMRCYENKCGKKGKWFEPKKKKAKKTLWQWLFG